MAAFRPASGCSRKLIGGSARGWSSAAVALVLFAVTGLLLNQQGRTAGPVWMPLASALSFTPLGWLVLRRAPKHPLGLLMGATGLCSTATTLAVCWSAWPPVAWLTQWLWWPPVALIPLMLLIFPDGRLPSRRWRPLAVGLVTLAAVATLALASGALMAPQTLLSTVGHPLPDYLRGLLQAALIAIAGVLLATAAVFVSLIGRWRQAEIQERRQLACLAPAGVLLVVGVVVDTLGVPGGWIPAVVALPLGFTLAILQFQLLNLDLFIHRGLVWIVLMGIAVSIFGITVAALDHLLGAGHSQTVTVVAGAACTAALLPAERFVQRALSRLLYGRRDDAYGVLMQVGRHIEAVRDPLAVLPRFAATLVETLRVPYAAIALTEAGDEPLMIEHGRRTGAEPQSFAMVAHGVQVGALLVEPRRPGTTFSATETQLMHGLALQAGVAAEACRSALDLQRARERLVLAREEERRRLRRDLHDGVASALVGARMLATAAQTAAPQDGRVPILLETLTRDLTVCTEEIRDLIDGLRPALLDSGLTSALHDVVARLSDSLPVELQISGDLDQLPAAVEVVSLRLVNEALTNVLKHAHARHAWVELLREDETLTVSVRDDGVGISGALARSSGGGVGLGSIRSRVEEVGGQFTTEQGDGGLCCRAVLPVRMHMAVEVRDAVRWIAPGSVESGLCRAEGNGAVMGSV